VAIERDDLGFLLAVASRRWNETLEERFAAAGFGEVRASYGAVLVPLFAEDGLRLGELARRAQLSKQTMTTLARLRERDGLVMRRPDESDARATRVFLTRRATAFAPVAQSILERLAGELEAALGATRFRQLRRALASVVKQLELDRPTAAPRVGTDERRW
jgi:DNA-binding MarR family transcriptional regulator